MGGYEGYVKINAVSFSHIILLWYISTFPPFFISVKRFRIPHHHHKAFLITYLTTAVILFMDSTEYHILIVVNLPTEATRNNQGIHIFVNFVNVTFFITRLPRHSRPLGFPFLCCHVIRAHNNSLINAPRHSRPPLSVIIQTIFQIVRALTLEHLGAAGV